MSLYKRPGKEPRYRLRVGIDVILPIPSLFGHVLDVGWQTNRLVLSEQEEDPGDTPEEVWIGGSVPPLRDLQAVVTALAPYGEIPLLLQLHLLEELDTLTPYPVRRWGKHLAAVCQHDPHARLTATPTAKDSGWLHLDARGWQMHPWTGPSEEEIAHLLFPDQEVPLEAVNSSLSDRAIVLLVHEQGMSLGLPVYAIFLRGVALCGPVTMLAEPVGLTARQADVVRQEILWVPDALRSLVSTLWYRTWRSVALRGW